jgi:hypothetical protein
MKAFCTLSHDLTSGSGFATGVLALLLQCLNHGKSFVKVM